MNSFTFGLWTGVVAGMVFAALMKQSAREPSMEEKLLGPHAASSTTQPPETPASAPASLADVLSQQDQPRA